MRIVFFLLFASVFLAAEPSGIEVAKAPVRNYFLDALPSLCMGGAVVYSPRSDFLIRQDMRKYPESFVSSLLLGLSYAHAIKLGEPERLSKSKDSAERIAAKRLTVENAETLLRESLEQLPDSTKWNKLDTSRYQSLKASGSCGFRTDAQLAKQIQNALSGLNAHRQVWLPSNRGASAKDRSLYDFEGYFLLAPSSEINFVALGSDTRAIYDLSGGKPFLRRLSGTRVPLKENAFGHIDDTFYSFRSIEAYTFGGLSFFYLFVTSDVIHTDGLRGKLIALEAGHYLAYYDEKSAYPDSGSVFKDSSGKVVLTEVDINRRIRAKLVSLLQSAGAKVLLDPRMNEPGNVRTGGRYNDMKWDVGYKPLVEWVNYNYGRGTKVDAFVSIHHNVRDNNQNFDYTEVYFGGKSLGMARVLKQETAKAIDSGSSDRNSLIPTSINPRSSYVNKLPTQVATALVEVQFTKQVYVLTKSSEAKMNLYVQKAATGLLNGLSRYFKGDFRPTIPVFTP